MVGGGWESLRQSHFGQLYPTDFTLFARLLNIFRGLVYNKGVGTERTPDPRPDVEAAMRGRDSSRGMEGEVDPAHASSDEAVFWTRIYREILEMEEKVLARVRELMKEQSETSRREVELTNVPVIEAQATRFRDRLGYWEERLRKVS
ncbi:MAG: hypothetical protein NVS3B24_03850 [Candidatus Dormibacteria bacterium]